MKNFQRILTYFWQYKYIYVINSSEAVKIGQETTSKGPAPLVRTKCIITLTKWTCFLTVSLYEVTKALLLYGGECFTGN